MYGIKSQDLKFIQKKHQFQRNYLNDKFFTTSSGQVKTLLDVSFSANHSKRYYNEIINKINTINEIIASDIVDYSSIFITVTLDGFFRDFLKGNFKRYKENKYKKFIPNNERFGYLRDKIENGEKFSIKDLYNVLNFQINRFQKSKAYTKIKKQGFKPHYIRVAEPHKKDGVPHIHMMLYIPTQFKEILLQVFKDYFPAPQNLKPLAGTNDGQLNGFQWDIKSAPAYILKYLFKSFLDVESGNEIDELQAWYIKHRILRCITSHSVVPAWVYRKVYPLEHDWHYLTDIKNNSIFECSREDDYFMFEDEYNRVIKYDKGVYQLFNQDRLIKQFGTKKEDKVEIETTSKVDYDALIKQRVKKRLDYRNKIIRERKEERRIYLVDGVKYVNQNKKLVKYTPTPIIAHMSNKFLEDHFKDLNIKPLSSIDSIHYKIVKNEMIKRNLFNNKKMIKNKDNKFELINTMAYEPLNKQDYGF
jgi:hypothetical protein